MKVGILTMLFFTLADSSFAANLAIRNDTDDCKRGGISMDVTVKVDSESFDFDPSCGFSFLQSFKTKSGLDCEVKAGMCSDFSPKNKFVVSCKGGLTKSINIECEDKEKVNSGSGKNNCTGDGQCCAHWVAGGSCAHKYPCTDCP